jgi:methionine-rich copper-binding protein CopC
MSTAPAGAHGLLKSATPAPNARVESTPQVVSVTLTQPPLPNGRLIVRDGCGRIVSANSNVEDDTITSAVRSAEPGKWRVRFDFVSAADGHRYARSYSFTVAGRRDCTRAREQPTQPSGSGEGPGDEMGMSDMPRSHESPGAAIPVAGLIAGSVIAFAIAVVARARPRTR